MRTDFVHCYPLQEAQRHAPSGPGVYQIRVPAGLLDYPKGKSAMVHYGSSANLRAAIEALAASRLEGDFLCRHQSSEEPAVLLEFVCSQFERRFGSVPVWPEPIWPKLGPNSQK